MGKLIVTKPKFTIGNKDIKDHHIDDQSIKDHHIEWGIDGSQVSSIDVPYDNVDSNLDSTTVKEALDELAAEVPTPFHQFLDSTQGQTRTYLINTYTVGNNSLLIHVNGQLQRVDEDYTEDTNDTIIFSEPLEHNDKLLFTIFRRSISLYEVQDATQGQTRVYLTSGTYIVGNSSLQVYVNGFISRITEDYVEQFRDTVVFVQALEHNDKLTFVVV